ncbi:MAG: DNA mismatch repair endonuclease MutL [Pseudomonadota bacterium]
MAGIRLLSEGLINRIAAGEVVERPAAALKELLENSLDAGAARIEVEAEDGGRKLVSVADNGTGMGPDDLLLSVERHATSKLTEDADLMDIATLGFRGEALPSIGAVSRMTIVSAPEKDGKGRRVHLSGGRLIGVEDAARDQGTTVEVRDLFFNVPARRKFLKSVQTEAAHLLEIAQRYVLGRPDLRLVYRHNGQEILSANPQESEQTRLALVLGRDTARQMFPFADAKEPLALSGFLGRPETERSRAGGLYLYVLGRPVADRLLTRAVLEAYKGRLSPGKHPSGVIKIDLDPRLVDVNAHPAKAEVRFRQPGDVFNAMVAIISKALSASARPTASPSPAVAAPSRPDSPRFPAFPRFQDRAWPGTETRVAESRAWEAPSRDISFPPVSPPRWVETVPPPDVAVSPGESGPELRPIGQLYKSYILAQGETGLFIIDQHAAHERVLFEKLKTGLAEGGLPSQALLLPETVELTPVQADQAQALLPDLARVGFDLAPFGGSTFVLRSIPAMLPVPQALRALDEIIGGLGGRSGQAALDDFETFLCQSLACHAAIKAGDEITLAEMTRLLADLDRAAVPTNCPHGRPLIFSLDRREIEKRFKRA